MQNMATVENPAEEVKRLQRSMGDLLSLTALPAMWIGGDWLPATGTLLDALLGMLRVDFAYVLLNDGNGGISDVVTLAQSLGETLQPGEIGTALSGALGGLVSQWPAAGRIGAGDAEFSIATVPMGLRDEIGNIVAGSQNPEFAGETDRLLLGVAANKAASGSPLAAQSLSTTKDRSGRAQIPAGSELLICHPLHLGTNRGT